MTLVALLLFIVVATVLKLGLRRAFRGPSPARRPHGPARRRR
jgi:hypothetical protein